MQRIDHTQLPGPGRLLRAILAWTISAAALVLLGALLLRLLHAGEESLAYVSAAVSFLSAFAAGLVMGKDSSRLLSGLICGFSLCILLLTLGFLIGGKAPDGSAVLSVTSFTIAGALSGAFLNRSGQRKRRRTSFVQHA